MRPTERVERVFVALVLLIAVLGGLMLPVLRYPTLGLAWIPSEDASIDAAFGAIYPLGAADQVLIAFEYGPAEADELDLVAEPILRQLEGQGVHVVAVSTHPEGMVMASRLLSAIPAAVDDWYQLGGYRPGAMTAVAHLLGEWGDDAAAVIVIAGQPAGVRGWAEQVALAGLAKPVIVGLSAAMEAVASPYLDEASGQITGSVTGLRGAAYYEKTLLGIDGRAVRRLQAMTAGQIAIVALMVVGALIHAVGGVRRRG